MIYPLKWVRSHLMFIHFPGEHAPWSLAWLCTESVQMCYMNESRIIPGYSQPLNIHPFPTNSDPKTYLYLFKIAIFSLQKKNLKHNFFSKMGKRNMSIIKWSHAWGGGFKSLKKQVKISEKIPPCPKKSGGLGHWLKPLKSLPNHCVNWDFFFLNWLHLAKMQSTCLLLIPTSWYPRPVASSPPAPTSPMATHPLILWRHPFLLWRVSPRPRGTPWLMT